MDPVPELKGDSDTIGVVVSFAGFALGNTIDRGEPRALLLHGRDDGTIPYALAEQTCVAATKAGVTSRLIAHEEGRGMADDVEATFDQAARFLRRQLNAEH